MRSAENIDRFIESKGGDKSLYLLKDKGQGNIYERWDLPFDKPTEQELSDIHDTRMAERQARKDKFAKRIDPRGLGELLVTKGIITLEELDLLRE